jgi:VanZ family protein
MMILTLLPGDVIARVHFIGFPNMDKIIHMILFLVFAFLFYISVFAINNPNNFVIYPIILTLAISIGYGLMIEIFQRFIPGRNYDLMDVMADGMGASIGLIIVIFRFKILRKKI